MRRQRTARLADDADWLRTVREHYAPLGVDVDREVMKARAWLATNPKGRGRQLTQSFVVRWLAKADRTVAGCPGDVGNGDPRREAFDRTVREVAEAVWIAKRTASGSASLSRALSALRDKYRGTARYDGVDPVTAGIERAMNNADPNGGRP